MAGTGWDQELAELRASKTHLQRPARQAGGWIWEEEGCGTRASLSQILGYGRRRGLMAEPRKETRQEVLWQLRFQLGPAQGRGWGEGGLPGWTKATATIPGAPHASCLSHLSPPFCWRTRVTVTGVCSHENPVVVERERNVVSLHQTTLRNSRGQRSVCGKRTQADLHEASWMVW